MQTHLRFRSTDLSTPNIKSFIDSVHDSSLPPTVVLVKSGPYIFGGFAADSWTL